MESRKLRRDCIYEGKYNEERKHEGDNGRLEQAERCREKVRTGGNRDREAGMVEWTWSRAREEEYSHPASKNSSADPWS